MPAALVASALAPTRRRPSKCALRAMHLHPRRHPDDDATTLPRRQNTRAPRRRASSSGQAQQSTARLEEVSLQVEDVKGVMVKNINRVIETSEQLSAVEDKSEGLRLGAQTFQRQSTELKNVLWWRNFKIKAIVAIVVLVVVGYIVIPIFVKQ